MLFIYRPQHIDAKAFDQVAMIELLPHVDDASLCLGWRIASQRLVDGGGETLSFLEAARQVYAKATSASYATRVKVRVLDYLDAWPPALTAHASRTVRKVVEGVMTRRRIYESYRNSVEGPTYQSASYYFDDAEGVRVGLHERSAPAGRYGRYSNPSWLEVERMLSELSRAESSLLFASGMAAHFTTFMTLLRAGDEVVLPAESYRQVRNVFHAILPKFGVVVHEVPIRDPAAFIDRLAELSGRVRLVHLEMPSSPHMYLIDLARVREVLGPDVIVTLDSSFSPPPNFYALDWGVDLVLFSATKYLGGHGDMVAGVVSGRADLIEEIRWYRHHRADRGRRRCHFAAPKPVHPATADEPGECPGHGTGRPSGRPSGGEPGLLHRPELSSALQAGPEIPRRAWRCGHLRTRQGRGGDGQDRRSAQGPVHGIQLRSTAHAGRAEHLLHLLRVRRCRPARYRGRPQHRPDGPGLRRPDLGGDRGPGRSPQHSMIGPESLSAGELVAEAFRPVHQRIEEAADRYPDRTAVIYNGRVLNYRRLDQLANGLAWQLAERGVGHGSSVPTLLVNSLELPISYLALMKCGATFVPLDPAWPADRLAGAIQTLAAPLLLAASNSAGEPYGIPTHEVAVDRLPATSRRPNVAVQPLDLAYGIFTSGTTGRPKCAMNYHGGLANRFSFMSRYFQATGTEVVLQNSKHTFDSSLWQLLWPLTHGAQVVLPVQQEFLNLHRTIEAIAAHQVTAADFVSSVFNAMMVIVDSEPDVLAKLRSLRWLIVGSEPVNPRAAQRLMSLLPGLRITNGYGPTETSIGMAFHPMSAEDGDSAPLGRPIDNCYIAIVDEHLELVPVGSRGEVAIGGACVGHGYLHAPVATARAFVPNPYPDRVAGDRLYLTGDLGHLDQHGRLFFAGRRDFQVKIGGMRIELGEIESAAERCPGVLQAEVLVADRSGDKSLALFARCAEPVTEDALRAELRTVLPRTSLPARYFLLPELPLSDNGKVDRDALQRMLDERLAAELDNAAVAEPDAELVDRVLRVMRSALGRSSFGPFEHFMDGGGDSLKAVAVIDQLRIECSVPQICAQDLFDHPTADRMALAIEMYQADETLTESEDELMAADAAAGTLEGLAHPDPATEVRTVLLTGATGFVGSRIAHELLADGDLRVICLVREGDDVRARAKVIDTLRERQLWRPDFAGRLDVVAGDLNLNRLGLRAEAWRRLAEEPDLVLHAAALVNFLYDYRAHRRSNLLGTIEMLRLAGAGRPVPFHYVSTLAALQSATTGRTTTLGESEADPLRTPPPPGGYNRSKWVAERYLCGARGNGGLITVLRLGEVMPALDNGIPNPVALAHLLISACYRLGVVPDADIRSDFSPVDYVAARLVAAVLDRAVWGSTLHVLHPQSVSVTSVLATEGGHQPPSVSCREFLRLLRQAAALPQNRDLGMLVGLLPDPDGRSDDELRELFEDLLTDNARIYGKDLGGAAERRWGMTEPALDGWCRAYRNYLARRYDQGDQGDQDLPARPELQASGL